MGLAVGLAVGLVAAALAEQRLSISLACVSFDTIPSHSYQLSLAKPSLSLLVHLDLLQFRVTLEVAGRGRMVAALRHVWTIVERWA